MFASEALKWPLAAAAVISVLAVVSSARAAGAEEAPMPEQPRDPSCAVERHVGVTAEEAAAVEEIVCAAIRESPARSAHHRIRIVKIGGKVVLTLVTDRPDGGIASKQLVLASLDEVTVAAPRLIEAAADEKPVAETVTMNNVVGEEARKPKRKHSEVHGWLGVIGAGSPDIATGGGVNLGISVGSDRWSFTTDFRLAGQSFNKPAALAMQIFTLGALDIESRGNFAYVSFAGGVRHHFSSRDVSPFVGAGLALDHIGGGRTVTVMSPYGGAYSTDQYRSFGNTGLAGYAEIGLDVLRTHAIGGMITIRADAPTFAVERIEWNRDVRTSHSSYAPVLSAGLAMRF